MLKQHIEKELSAKTLRKVIGVIIFSAVVVTSAALAGHAKDRVYLYFEEKQAVTYISALLLSLTAFSAFVLSILTRLTEPWKGRLNFWMISAVGFAYLSIDEYFMLHEGMDTPLVDMLGRDHRIVTLDSLVFVALGLSAVLLLIRFKDEILRYKGFITLCVLGFTGLAGMIVFDMLNQNNAVVKVAEEAFKIIGVTYFFTAYFSAMHIRLRQALSVAGERKKKRTTSSGTIRSAHTASR